MALRNQPYLPLYVQDFMTDEKLMECSASSTGVYIRLMCVLHKSDEYGVLLLKQKDKQNGSKCLNFAYKLAKFMPYDVDEIFNALTELENEGVIEIDDEKLTQKRMVKDNTISNLRSEAGSKGGKKTQFDKAKIKASAKAKVEANSESENENDIHLESKDSMKGKRLDKLSPEVFYQTQIALSNNDIAYKKYVDVLFGNNDAGYILNGILGMEKQITFDQFQKLLAKSKEKNESLIKLTLAFENGKYFKNKKSIYLSLNDWLNKR